MGIAEYTISVRINNNNIISELNDSYIKKYNKFFFYFPSLDKTSAVISAYIDNFLPSTLAIYDFIKPYINMNLIISTLNSEVLFNFETRASFLFFMYDLWESYIVHKYEIMGALVVPPEKSYYSYHKRKLKKYYCMFKK